MAKRMNFRVTSRLIRLFDEDDDEEVIIDDDLADAGGFLNGVAIVEKGDRPPEFTGILSPDAEPIFRCYMQKPGIGFNVEGIEYYDPDAYFYAVNPNLVVGEQEEEGEFVEDEEPLYDEEEE